MSTVPANENTPKTPEPITVKKSYEFFDENLVMQKKEVEVTFNLANTYEEAVTRLGNDPAKLLEGANVVIRREALSEARKNAGVSGGINRAVLMEFIKPYRELPQFASMITASDKRKATAEEWDKQTSSILEQIKGVPFIMDAIKLASQKANENDD